MTVTGLYQSASEAATLFQTFGEGAPDLCPLGLPEVDNTIGGVFPGTLVVVAADQGVGKSRTALTAALNYAETAREGRTGIISLEDPADVVGGRLLAWASGVPGLKIRRKDLDDNDLEDLEEGMKKLRALDDTGRAPVFSYRIGGNLNDIEDAVEQLAMEDCKIIWLDYLQKVRGVSDDRRNEVGRVLSAFQRVCARHGIVPVVISQFTRRDLTKPPQLHHLKESGDIENEARVILLGYDDHEFPGAVCFRLAKSTYGGGGLMFRYRTDPSGHLVPFNPYESEIDNAAESTL